MNGNPEEEKTKDAPAAARIVKGPGLFETTRGNASEAYLILRSKGKTVPYAWVKSAQESRKKRQDELGIKLKEKSLDAFPILRQWESALEKERFYYGLRALFDLEQNGETKL
ncbi:MAG: hypothetical protein A2509_03535 [Candidatus Edwardsbacteria bacterium RIFOXYD12_FULL_50_11]|uniref:Uncharacterized protein n=1 Tax=Candidatus Edwardsbacteria bacterium GWF2_54_11 TaxID=1817851 RepID=A0A1F5R8Z3_9BACT|nr:hypothetical protein [Candidatus Edwardsbacteria bacterium]OGF05413.1 MAG: hypothetical protein A2502_03450 [Candidatus Edwardsbacteria bacterium RifOxyC12_full_54_24]OGF07769.1 MAG: hypothetical protein A2273_04700 [Candidatus Edwardsbacteria bacterium RifOxyA12_full_54_48]OGF10017.1 MAG: hypothetical protein A3K15_11110 [Candidatus Edwardsbacteria bacterium GWE2_54_12]OGF10513.1 MAG: hypothetical protein A2024_09200 [Candidatus Edwardsbacteria bacterium GWF2_54_11]OGF14929.1 MAG: hypothet